jgi:hypothetical protein
VKSELQRFVIHVHADDGHEFHVRKNSLFDDEREERADGTIKGIPYEKWEEFLKAAMEETGAFNVEEDPYKCYYEFTFLTDLKSEDTRTAGHRAYNFVRKHFYEVSFS